MSKNIAFLFPGQGSQYPGMGKELYENFPVAKEVFEEANETLGYDLAALCFEGTEAELQQTEKTQPAILTVSIAAERILAQEGIRPVITAGHSLGEYSALVAAGAISFKDAVRVVARRGRFMQDAVPEGQGAMAAILGLGDAEIEDICSKADGKVSAANFNSPGQVVIAGEKAAVERTMEAARAAGAKRALLLPMSVPSHCELMRPARERLAVELDGISFSTLGFPLVANVDAQECRDGETARENLKRQVTSPVRWTACMEKIAAKADMAIEIGPGKVLLGLLKRIKKDMPGFNVEDKSSLEKTLEMIRRG